MVTVVGKENIFAVCPIIKILYEFAVPRDYLQIPLPYPLKLFKIIMFITSFEKSLQNNVYYYNKCPNPHTMGSMYKINNKNLVVLKKKIDQLSSQEFVDCLKLSNFMQHFFAEMCLSRIFIHRVLGLSHNLTLLRNIFNIKDLNPDSTKLYSNLVTKYECLIFNSSHPRLFKKMYQSGDITNNTIKWIFNNGIGELQCNSNCETIEIERIKNFPIKKITKNSSLNRVTKK